MRMACNSAGCNVTPGYKLLVHGGYSFLHCSPVHYRNCNPCIVLHVVPGQRSGRVL